MGLDQIVDVSITSAIASVSRKGFGVPMLASWFPTSIFTGRARTYTKLSDMVDDGFLATDPAYMMASELKRQNPSLPTWKVGRRGLAYTHTLKLTPLSSTTGDVIRFTVEGVEIEYVIPAASSIASVCTALVALLASVVGVTASDNTTYVGIVSSLKTAIRLTVTTQSSAEVFRVTIDGVNFDYTSDGSGTKTEIRDGLQALIEAAGYTTTDVSTDASDIVSKDHRGAQFARTNPATGVLTISAAVSANQLVSIGAISSSTLKVEDTTSDPGIATDLSAIEAADSEFYGLLIDSSSEHEVEAASAWANSRTLLFGYDTIETIVKDPAVTTDVGSDLHALSARRTFGLNAEFNQEFAAAGWMGGQFPYDPGSTTWRYKKIAGATPSVLTGAQEAGLNAKSVNHYTTINSVPVTQKGRCQDGTPIDLVHGTDWFRSRLQERFFGLLVSSPKLPYTDASCDIVRGLITAQLEEGRRVGLIAPNTADTPWVITIPKVADVDPVDRAARLLPDIVFAAYYAGAMEEFQMQGTLSV